MQFCCVVMKKRNRLSDGITKFFNLSIGRHLEFWINKIVITKYYFIKRNFTFISSFIEFGLIIEVLTFILQIEPGLIEKQSIFRETCLIRHVQYYFTVFIKVIK